MRIQGTKVSLRDFEARDLGPFGNWLQPGHRWRDWDGPYYRVTEELTLARLERRRKLVESGGFPDPRTCLVIADLQTDSLIGEVNSYWKSEETFWMCMGIDLFDDSLWGKGFGAESLALWTDYLFASHPEIVRLGLETWSGNHGMIRLALKLGFQEEARIRKARIVNGKYFDALSFGVLREEWEVMAG